MDFLREYKLLKKQHFPIAETLRFGRALGESNDINVHFEIYCLDMQSPPQERGLMIYESFSDHGRKGGDYLLTRLSDDDNIASLAAYLLASWRVQRACQFSAEENTSILGALSRLSESNDPKVRRRSLIAIGWIGGEKEIPLLNTHLLTDSDALCRSWSASSFLQMAEGKLVECHALQQAIKDSLVRCLNEEKDVFVRGVIVLTIQTVWGTSFGLRQSAVDTRLEKAIERASAKALLFLARS